MKTDQGPITARPASRDAGRRIVAGSGGLYRSFWTSAAAQQVFDVGSVIMLGLIRLYRFAWFHMPPAELFVSSSSVFARVTPHLSGLPHAVSAAQERVAGV